MYKAPLAVLVAMIGIAGCAEQSAVTAMRHTDYVVASAPSAVAGSTAASAGQRNGTVESVAAVRDGERSAWRLGVRMDDGTVRSVDTLADGVMLGQRVAIDADGRVSTETGPVLAHTVTASPSAATGGSAATPAYESRWVAPRSGLGRIETLTAVPNLAGFTGSEPILSVWQVGTRMDDGSLQVIDTPASGLAIGQRVRITDGTIARAE